MYRVAIIVAALRIASLYSSTLLLAYFYPPHASVSAAGTVPSAEHGRHDGLS